MHSNHLGPHHFTYPLTPTLSLVGEREEENIEAL